ncbi:MAG: pseudouridine synthase [Lachnospiraceae bacterium]|nr:pseudouridine synthase [Lachnospiraceae bacterium]
MDKERLNKYLASCGVCSRREADRLIEEGRVTVNGERAATGMQVGEEDHIFVNGKEIHGKNKKVVLAYYKPVGVICTEKDRFADKKITDMVKFPVRVTYAGRLDKDSEGLILLSNDGALIDAMMRGSAGHEKEYVVKVNKEISEDFIQKMEAGVYLTELAIKTKPCKLEKIGKFTFKIILTQGVNRQIKRMAKEMGYHVVAIKRIRVMNVTLSGLTPGQYRQLSGTELQLLYNSCFGENSSKSTKYCAGKK